MKHLVFSLAFVLLSLVVRAQWIQVNGPKDPFAVADMIVKDSLLLTAASHGSFYSSDSGSTWKPLMPESFNTSVLYRDTIYTGGEKYPGSGPATVIRRLTFAGGTWQLANVLEYGGLVNDMFAKNDTIFAAYSRYGGTFSNGEGGFTFSSDGINWSKYNTGLPKDSVLGWSGYDYVYNLFAVSANSKYVFTGTKKGIYRSPLSAFNWSAKNNGLPEEKVSAVFCNESLVVVAVDNKMYKSVDQGETWEVIFTFSGGNVVNRIRLISDTLFALTETQGLFLSGDWGASWFPANDGLTSLQTRCITRMGPAYFLGGGSGIMKGLDRWEPSDSNLISSNVRDLEQTGSCMAAVEMDEIFISKDEGLTWNKRTPFQPPGVLWSVANVNGCLFFSFCPPYPADCANYLSCDNGDTWTVTAPLPNYGDSYVLRSNGNKMIAFTDNVIFISSDNGSNWSNISPPLANGFNDVLFTGNDLYICAGYTTAHVVHSSDFGLTWNHCEAGLGSEIYKFGYAGGAVFAFSATSLSKTFNDGQTWQECGALGDGVQDFTVDGNLIFACRNTSVYVSRDMGLNWTDISAGLPPLPGLWGGTLMVRDHFLCFGTYSFGIWKISTQSLPSSVNEISSDPEFKLYPNPAGQLINVVSRRNKEIKKMDILDLSGRVVKSVRPEGNKIETGSLNPDLYFLQIETTDHMQYHEKFVKH